MANWPQRCTENKEIATLPLVARNDKKGIATESPRGTKIQPISPHSGPLPLGEGEIVVIIFQVII